MSAGPAQLSLADRVANASAPVRLARKVVERIRLLAADDEGVAAHFRSQGATIGTGTRILTKSLGSEPYLVTIGDGSLISSDVLFSTHDGATWVLRDELRDLAVFDRITIGRRAFVGARSVLLPGCSVGDRSVIGAGSVVNGAIPDGVVAVGVPARVISTVDEFRDRCVERSVGPVPADRGDLASFLVQHFDGEARGNGGAPGPVTPPSTGRPPRAISLVRVEAVDPPSERSEHVQS
jgi:acetyltransferase-like isoleucine patch superfamily enzyme